MSVEETRLSVGLERVVELSEFVESLIGLGGWKKSVIWGWGFVGRVLASCAHVKIWAQSLSPKELGTRAHACNPSTRVMDPGYQEHL